MIYTEGYFHKFTGLFFIELKHVGFFFIRSRNLFTYITFLYSGECYVPNIDIGVLYKPRYYKDTAIFFADRKRVINLFETIHTSFAEEKYFFAPSFADDDTYPFDKIDSEMLHDVVKAYHGTQKYYIDIMKRSTEVLNNDFNEQYQDSYAKVKSLIVLTENALTKEELKTLMDENEEVDVINFVLNTKSVEGVQGGGGEKKRFSFEEVQLYVKRLKTLKAQTICN